MWRRPPEPKTEPKARESGPASSTRLAADGPESIRPTPPQNVREWLSTRSPLHWLFFISMLLSFAVVAQLLVPVATGAVLAYISEGPIAAIERRLGLRAGKNARWWVAGLFVLVAFTLVLVPVGLAAFTAVRDAIELLASVRPERWVELADGVLEVLNSQLALLGIRLTHADLIERGRLLIAEHVGWLTRQATSMLTATPEALFSLLLMLTSWVFLAVSGRQARYALVPRLIPWRFERFVVAETAEEVIHSVFLSNAAVALVQGLGCLVLMVLLGIPKALVWTVLAVFLAFVPIVGTVPITLGSALYCWANGRIGAAIAFGIGAVVIGTIDNVLRPLFMRSSVDLNFLWLLIALVGGVSLFGFSGLVLGPFVLSLFVASWRALDVRDPVDLSDAVASGEERAQTRASIAPPRTP